MQTLSRYYSNTFSDADKQNAMNVFLGIYVPGQRNLPHIWDLVTDYYLHNAMNGTLAETAQLKPLTLWWDENIPHALPLAADQVFKGSDGRVLHAIKVEDTRCDERTDGFYENRRPYELTVIKETLSFTMLDTTKDFMPNFTTDASPFAPRTRPDKRREPQIGKAVSFPPSLSAIASTSSQSSSPSEASDVDEEDELDFRFHLDTDDDSQSLCSDSSCAGRRSFESLLSDSKNKYGIENKAARDADIALYSDYVNVGKRAGLFSARNREEASDGESDTRTESGIKLVPRYCTPLLPKREQFENNSSYSFTLRAFDKRSRDVYHAYVERARVGAEPPAADQIALYRAYLQLAR